MYVADLYYILILLQWHDFSEIYHSRTKLNLLKSCSMAYIMIAFASCIAKFGTPELPNTNYMEVTNFLWKQTCKIAVRPLIQFTLETFGTCRHVLVPWLLALRGLWMPTSVFLQTNGWVCCQTCEQVLKRHKIWWMGR